MKTDWRGLLAFLLIAGLLGAWAWISNDPGSPFWDRATEWPVIGELVEKVRGLYWRPEGDAPAPSPRDGDERSVEIVVELLPPEHTALPQIWLDPGARLHAAPDADSPVVATVETLSLVGYHAVEGRWHLVARTTMDDRVEGWVEVVDVERARPVPRGPETIPATPMAAVAIDPAHRARAAALMTAPVEGRCGPFALLSDVRSSRLDALCATLVPRIEAAYAERYGRVPVGEAAETVLAFADRPDFVAFVQRASERGVEANGLASTAMGYVALAWDDAEAERRSGTLVHELVHLLNRRALGPALPPWLDEGLADDLAEELAGSKLEAAAWRLGMDRAGESLPPLEQLLDLDTRAFYRGRGYANYAQSLLVVRLLVEHPELRDGFLSFLDAVASGEVGDLELLASHLGLDAAGVEAIWQRWLAARRQSFPATGR